jgi:CheY-like chemotaxis protein
MPKIILIVEDHFDSRQFLKFLLEDYGYKTSEAASGLEAVESVKNQTPDLILMDLALPDMDGLAATKMIREIEGGSRTPIIAATAYWAFYYKQAIDLGFNEIIEKPIDHEKLRNILSFYLEQ